MPVVCGGEDVEVMVVCNSRAGVVSLARAGGGTTDYGLSCPQACAAGLAAMFVAVAAPNTAFFTCAIDFNNAHTWLSQVVGKRAFWNTSNES